MGSPQAEIVAWVLFPAVFIATGLGAGLLITRVLRLGVPGALTLPLGVCGTIVAVMPVYAIGLDGRFAAALLVVIAVVGFATRGRDVGRAIRDALLGPWMLSGLVVLGCYLAPAVLTGAWTWTGYNFVNDTAVQFLLTDWLADHGTGFDVDPATTTLAVVQQYLAGSYPLGTHAHLATFQTLLGTPVPVLYQTYIALLMATTALALHRLATRAGLTGVPATVVAAIAPLAVLTYQYGLQGNVKEVAALTTVATAVAVARELLDGRDATGWAIALGLCLAATLDVFAGAGVPYVLAVAGCAFVAAVLVGKWRGRGALPAAIAAGAGALVLLAVPALVSIAGSLRTLNASVADTGMAPPLGQLARQLPLAQAGGVWLTGDYRFPVVDARAQALTTVALAVVGVLLVGAIVWLVVRRETGPLVLLGALGLTYVLVASRTSPYADGKMLAILSPGVLFVALVGAWALSRRFRIAGIAAMGVVSGLVLLSCAYAYHNTRLAPTDRMRALADIDVRFAGNGPMLFNEYEEFAKYFLRNAQVNASTDAVTPRPIDLRSGDGYQYLTYDLDAQKLAYVQGFPFVVVRRGPAASRPPAGFRLAYQNDFYAVWKRVDRPSALEHLSLGTATDAAGTAPCRDVLRLARDARPGEALVAAAAPVSATFDPLSSKSRPFGWPPDPERPGLVFMSTPGIVRGSVSLPVAGRYEVWVQGSFGRPLAVRVDGREVGMVNGTNTPGAWLAAGSLPLSAGKHAVEAQRRGGTLAPGDGSRSSVGSVALMKVARESLVQVAPQDARRLCGERWDWIERVTGQAGGS